MEIRPAMTIAVDLGRKATKQTKLPWKQSLKNQVFKSRGSDGPEALT